MPFGIRVKTPGFLLEFVAGVTDEVVNGIWNSNSTSTGDRTAELAGQVLKVGTGGAILSRALSFGKIITDATVNLLI